MFSYITSYLDTASSYLTNPLLNSNTAAGTQSSKKLHRQKSKPAITIDKDLELQLQQFKEHRTQELTQILSARKQIIMNTYQGILLGGCNLVISLAGLLIYALVVEWLSRSALFFLASAYLVFVLASFDLGVFRIVSLVQEKYTALTSMSAEQLDQLHSRLRIKPLSFEELCSLLATVETKYRSWVIYSIYVRKQSSLLYLSSVLTLFSLVWLVTSLLADSTILIMVALVPVILPALYHYDVSALLYLWYNQIKEKMFAPATVSVGEQSIADWTQTTLGRMKRFYADYQDYIRHIPDELQPKDLSSAPLDLSFNDDKVAGGGDKSLYEAAFAYVATKVSPAPTIAGKSNAVVSPPVSQPNNAATIIPTQRNSKSEEPGMRNRRQGNSSSDDLSSELGYEFVSSHSRDDMD